MVITRVKSIVVSVGQKCVVVKVDSFNIQTTEKLLVPNIFSGFRNEFL